MIRQWFSSFVSVPFWRISFTKKNVQIDDEPFSLDDVAVTMRSFVFIVVAIIIVVHLVRVMIRAYESFQSQSEITLETLGLSPVSSTWETDRIPMIIHQTAPADETKWHHLWKGCQLSWFDNYGGFEYKMWTDEELDDFIKSRFPNFYPIWLAYPENIYRIDVARYFILYEYVGIYADMDYECVRPFYDMLPVGKVSIAESAISWEDYQNALMATPARHPFWHSVLDECLRSQHASNVLEATGPRVISRAIKSVPASMVHAWSEHTFAVQTHPKPHEPFERSVRTDVFAIHHGSCAYC
jgi:mannosyltransferase OCH1-like enzyme